jgi:signal transduction histidine kinase
MGAILLRNTSVLILTDDGEFARLLTACWQTERQLPAISLLTSDLWKSGESASPDLIVIGPMKHLRLSEVLQTLEPGTAVIFCADSEHADSKSLRKRFPKLLQVPLREDWAQMVLVLAGESLRRTEALKIAKQAERNAALNANQAMLGRYMIDMKHNLNNALTSLLGNAELLLLEPGQLSTQSLAQIKTMHTMALRINEIMQRFSSLAAEMRDAETPSQPETEYQRLPQFTQR